MLVYLQVFYKTVCNIPAGEEMLLYAQDSVYPEKELQAMQTAMQGELTLFY